MAKEHETQYAETWGTALGRDCITLKQSLAAWLGPRLLYLAEHTSSGAPGIAADEGSFEQGRQRHLADMARHGRALASYGETGEAEEQAQAALLWVAENFPHLWD